MRTGERRVVRSPGRAAGVVMILPLASLERATSGSRPAPLWRWIVVAGVVATAGRVQAVDPVRCTRQAGDRKGLSGGGDSARAKRTGWGGAGRVLVLDLPAQQVQGGVLEVVEGGEIDEDLGVRGESPQAVDQRVQNLLIRFRQRPGGDQVHASSVRVDPDENGQLAIHGRTPGPREGRRGRLLDPCSQVRRASSGPPEFSRPDSYWFLDARRDTWCR